MPGHTLETKLQIIQAAKTLFKEQNIIGVTMAQIAEVARLGRATIYRYFRSKEEILAEVLQNESENIMLRLIEITKGAKTAAEKLKRYAVARTEAVQEFMEIYRKSLQTRNLFSPRIINVFNNLLSKELELLKSIFEEGIRTGEFGAFDAETAAEGIIAALCGMEAIEFFGKLPKQWPKKTEKFLELIINGMKSLKKGRVENEEANEDVAN